jgi:regulator of sigma E protease
MRTFLGDIVESLLSSVSLISGKLLIPILVLGLLIFVHELGHFLVARFWKVTVLEFAIGFGKKLFSFTRNGTLYSLGVIPLGGFVRMAGEDPSETPSSPEETRNWFSHQTFWPKATITAAGAVFNLLFALLLSIASTYIYGYAVPSDQPVIGALLPGNPAARAGLKVNDRVVSINGASINSWLDLSKTVSESGGKPLSFTILRPLAQGEPQSLTIEVTAEKSSVDEIAVLRGEDAPPPTYRIGIMFTTDRESVTSLFQAASIGSTRIVAMVTGTFRGLLGMIRGLISTKNLAGPIFILQETGQKAQAGAAALIDFVILLSVSLAVLNLLPIPILDGGHLVVFLLEAIKGGPVSLKAQERARQVGFAVLLLIFGVALFNDIQRLFQ